MRSLGSPATFAKARAGLSGTRPGRCSTPMLPQTGRQAQRSSRVESCRRQLLGTLLGGSTLTALGMWRPGTSAAAVGSSEMEKVLEDPKWPAKWPFRPEDFLRYDEADDAAFYSQPRFVYHIDDGAVGALTKWAPHFGAGGGVGVHRACYGRGGAAARPGAAAAELA
ncbi:hypothetical protein MNEG_11668 [Monoraphidium neglectum]|uniref:Uncharacterized protein n=1 Tax=Monoraphidium neglectum TaxID=145388 RepID=A0A0D2J990_9CHLO|nr:hypothetical protein MNEG_11668 [Monoraphidium neglectum]KIY96297.1 hypothetical protein MNEG_11668 [Monoraphidium neglectum]|eukprot:XP_013895317.1 hypothetical protein MNEG_11668 [Monoraphidium neglectum]